MPLLATTYCSVADVKRLFSSAGVDAYADHDGDSSADTDVVEDCINQATEEIDAYARQRYTQSGLSGSTLINRWCTTLAVYFLCMRRGNTIPDAIATETERILDPDKGLLSRLAAGNYHLPGVAMRADMRPSWSNLRIDRRYPRSKTRVTRTNSSDSPTKLTRDFEENYPSHE